MKKVTPQFMKNFYHWLQSVLANFVYDFPSKKIKVIGVTGTNGKTTTVQMITKILEEAHKDVAMSSTINFKIRDKEWVNDTKYTTLSPFAVQKFIRQAVDSGCEYLVLETSSHALDQYRVGGVNFQTAVITNVTREHLDYHGTMEEYRKAKEKLFQEVAKKPQGVAVVNANMENPDQFLKYGAAKQYSYRIDGQSYNIQGNYPNMTSILAENVKLELENSQFTVAEYGFSVNLIGEFNVENALAAICVCSAEGIDPETISMALDRIKGVPGRLEKVPNDRGLEIIIDYAVTPDSLEKLYKLILKIKKPESKVISVFGACGDRDRGKRPMMGGIVSRAADFVIVTNEDPYHEDPQRIINEVASGVENKQEGSGYWKMPDRREAIRSALQMAKPGDYVMVTGKGAEETMAIGNVRIPWSDRQVILEELARK